MAVLKHSGHHRKNVGRRNTLWICVSWNLQDICPKTKSHQTQKYLKFFPHLMPTSFNRPSNGLVATFSHPLHLSPPTVQLIGTKGDTAQLWSSKTYGILKRKHPGNPPGLVETSTKKPENHLRTPRNLERLGTWKSLNHPLLQKEMFFGFQTFIFLWLNMWGVSAGGVFQPPHLLGSQQDGGFRSRDHYKWSDQGAPKIMVL